MSSKEYLYKVGDKVMLKEEITKEKIIETIELHSVGRHFGEYREITHEDCEDIADELLTLMEQEKKEVAREWEDKIENGTLVELPCKVGDVVWYVIDKGEYSTLCSTTVSRIIIDSPNKMVIHLNGTVRKIYIGYPQEDNAFFTKAEAEKRLAKLQKKDDYEDFLATALGYDELHLPQKTERVKGE